MIDLDECKDFVARQKGYPNWEEMQNFIVDHNESVNVALLLVSAMELASYEYARRVLNH